MPISQPKCRPLSRGGEGTMQSRATRRKKNSYEFLHRGTVLLNFARLNGFRRWRRLQSRRNQGGAELHQACVREHLEPVNTDDECCKCRSTGLLKGWLSGLSEILRADRWQIS
jgi:hypothetical protein